MTTSTQLAYENWLEPVEDALWHTHGITAGDLRAHRLYAGLRTRFNSHETMDAAVAYCVDIIFRP